jgi:hypothetical protein
MAVLQNMLNIEEFSSSKNMLDILTKEHGFR